MAYNQELDTSRTFPREKGVLLIKQHHIPELNIHVRLEVLTVLTNFWEYDAVYIGKSQSTFRRKISTPSSESKSNPSRKPALNWQQTALLFIIPPCPMFDSLFSSIFLFSFHYVSFVPFYNFLSLPLLLSLYTHLPSLLSLIPLFDLLFSSFHFFLLTFFVFFPLFLLFTFSLFSSISNTILLFFSETADKQR